MSPLFKNESERGKRLRLAASILSEISCYENKEYRGELAFRRILDSSLNGLNHKDRVFIATCLYYRYNNYTDNNILYLINPFLNSKVKQKAKIVGSAMKLARSISCSCKGILENTKLEIKNNQLVLSISENHISLDGESINKRTRFLADTIGVNYTILTK
jgi:exopolyphosphatase/guanosine-5'-triphosphate,3'-diphosphate pyrophosphatase